MSPSNGHDRGAPVVAVLLDDLGQLLDDDVALARRLGQDVAEVVDHRLQLVVVLDDLLPLQGGQAAQLHVEDRRGLHLVDLEQLHQAVRASSTVGERRISAMTSSSASSALSSPRRMWMRSSALRSR